MRSMSILASVPKVSYHLRLPKPWLSLFSLDGERTVKRKTRVWLLAIAILVLIATTYEVLAIYFTPPSYLSTSRMMLEGRLTIGLFDT